MITIDELTYPEPARKALKVLLGLEVDEFLGGPGREHDEIDVDPVFASPLADVMKDFAEDAEDPRLETAHQAAIPDVADWPLLLRRAGLTFHRAMGGEYGPHGVVARDGSGLVVGAYIGCKLAVAEERQREGIGTTLVMLRYFEDEGLPLWGHDKPAFSPAGEATHLRAYDELLSIYDATPSLCSSHK